MTEPVFYFRGIPSPSLSPHEINAGMAYDARRLMDQPDIVLQGLRSILQDFNGFLDFKQFSHLVAQVIPGDHGASEIASACYFLNKAAQGNSAVFKRRFSDWAKSDENLGKEVPIIDDTDRLSVVLDLVIDEYPNLGRQLKAERVAKTLGKPLESFQLICEMRPVFDQDRKHIEGMLPVTTLRIIATDVTGMPEDIEVVLTRGQVMELSESMTKAKQKLDAITKYLDEHRTLIPLTYLTETNEQERRSEN